MVDGEHGPTSPEAPSCLAGRSSGAGRRRRGRSAARNLALRPSALTGVLSGAADPSYQILHPLEIGLDSGVILWYHRPTSTIGLMTKGVGP